MVPHKMSLHVLQIQLELVVKSGSQPQQGPPKLEKEILLAHGPVTPDTPADSATPPAEDKQPESIEDRLNDLLQQTSYKAQTSYRTQTPYKVVFLTNTNAEQPTAEYKAGQQMKLNVTVCLIMYNEPSFENSFLNKTESDSDAIL